MTFHAVIKNFIASFALLILTGIASAQSVTSLQFVCAPPLNCAVDSTSTPTLTFTWVGSTITGIPAVGDIIYATGATTMGLLSDVATGSVLLSGGITTAPLWGKLPLTNIATQAANTLVGNVTGSTAAPTAISMPSCADTGGNHLNYVDNTGFTCGTSGGGSGAISATSFSNSGAFSLSGIEINLTPTGSDQAGALLLDATKAVHHISTTSYNVGVRLPAAVAGAMHWIKNEGTDQILVYPTGSETIDGLSAGVAAAVGNGFSPLFISTVNGVWKIFGITRIFSYPNLAITLDGQSGIAINMNPTNLIFGKNAPSVSGFCTSPSVVANNGSGAFTINVGTSCTGVKTGTITMGDSATTGWACSIQDITTPDNFVVSQTGGTTNTVTVKNYSRTTGASADFTASEVVRVMCLGY